MGNQQAFNPIQNLTDQELAQAVTEIFEDEPKGIFRIDGWVRKLNEQVQGDATGLIFTQYNIFREFSRRKILGDSKI